MKTVLISCGQRTPSWVAHGCAEYNKRLPKHLQIQHIKLPTAKAQDSKSCITIEGKAITQAIPARSTVVILDTQGKMISTEKLATQLSRWLQESSTLCFVIGGPYGLCETIRQKAHFKWCLSDLTFPHQLVNIILTEQLYRAHCILQNHPYHHA